MSGLSKSLRPIVLLAAAAACCLHAGPTAHGQDDALPRTARIEDSASLGVGKLVPDLELKGIDDKSVRLSALLKDKKSVVLCMTSATCPLAMKYAARLTNLADEYTKRDVAFVMVNTSDTDSLEDMHQQIRGARWRHPYLPDGGKAVRHAMEARTTTEAFVIDAGRTLVYRGAVDDQFGIGVALDAPRRTYLRDALEALLAGREIETGATFAPGCAIAPPDEVGGGAGELTYSNQIARILQSRCINCHHNGGSGPFSLETYKDVTGRATMLEAVVRSGIMPPWGATSTSTEPGKPSPWRHDLSMPQWERDQLISWLESDRPEGDKSDAPTPRTYNNGWTIGKPDAVLLTQGVDVPADGPMMYAEIPVAMDPDFIVERWINAIEVLPRTRKLVHHVVLSIVTPKEGSPAPDPAKLQSGAAAPTPPVPAADAEHPPRLDDNEHLIGAFGPAFSGITYAPQSSLRLPAGAWIKARTYVRPLGKPMRELVRIGLRFATQPPPEETRTQVLLPGALAIPANIADSEATSTTVLEGDTYVSAITPLLAFRGKSFRVDAKLPSGESTPLLNVNQYDYRWCVRYELREPLLLPKGTQLECRAAFDNTSDNANNPHHDRSAGWGWGPADELMLAIIESRAKRP